jgi:hypothetical protein
MLRDGGQVRAVVRVIAADASGNTTTRRRAATLLE